MTLELVAIVVVMGLGAGWLAGIVLKDGGYGLTGDILLGLGGSIVGSWLFRALGIAPEAGRLATVVVAFGGAAGPDRGPAQDLASERLEERERRPSAGRTPPEAFGRTRGIL